MFLPERRCIHWLLTFAALACSQLATAQTTVRVVQYNIERTVGSPSSNTAGQPALAKILKYLAPDVWTISELGGFSADYDSATMHALLAAFIDSYDIFGPTAVDGQDYFIYIGQRTDGYIAQAIVSRYPFLSTQTFSDAGGGYPALRGLVHAHVNLPGAIELGVFTAHLKALNATSDAEKRQAEATADTATLQTWLGAHAVDAAVMTGDLNESEEPGDSDNWSGGVIGGTLPSGNVYRPITTVRDAGFADGKPASIAGNRDTLDSTSPDVRFDYVLHTASHLTYLSGEVFDTKQHSAAQLAALNAANGTSFVLGDSAAASDHLPVLEVFLVSPGAPYIAAQSASSLASTTATLGGALNPNGFATSWRIELGTNAAYGATSFSQALPAGTTNANVAFQATGLTPATTYHYRFVAENGAGISTGPDRTFMTAAFVDSDGDGLPNDWETANGFNPSIASDATLDSDGDGETNREEFVAGTNPRNGASALRIISFTRAGADLAISWPSVFAKRYDVQYRAGLASGTWSVLQSGFLGTGAVMNATDPNAATSLTQRFYRVVAQP
ncbi:MAG TPA: endonuclease/exonuclease/phosphatase family protein [Chthoniobacteraceae bacterium]|nr:endonuclease/exonuclease/phosphatase family protein [Chthoniobacteraceae bacterium]